MIICTVRVSVAINYLSEPKISLVSSIQSLLEPTALKIIIEQFRRAKEIQSFFQGSYFLLYHLEVSVQPFFRVAFTFPAEGMDNM